MQGGSVATGGLDHAATHLEGDDRIQPRGFVRHLPSRHGAEMQTSIAQAIRQGGGRCGGQGHQAALQLGKLGGRKLPVRVGPTTEEIDLHLHHGLEHQLSGSIHGV